MSSLFRVSACVSFCRTEFHVFEYEATRANPPCKLRNCTHTGKFIAFYLRFLLGHTSVSPTTSSPVYFGSDGGVILSVLTYLGGLLIVLVVYSSCGAFALQSFELQISLGDAAVRDSTIESAI